MKNIVICSDGTGNEYGENNTNVVETYTICRKTPAQIVFYDPGVGTGGWEYIEGRMPGEESLTSLSDQNSPLCKSFAMRNFIAVNRGE